MTHTIPGQEETDGLIEMSPAEEGLAPSSANHTTNLTITIPTPFAAPAPVTISDGESQQSLYLRSWMPLMEPEEPKSATHHYLQEGVDIITPAVSRVKWVDVRYSNGGSECIWVEPKEEVVSQSTRAEKAGAFFLVVGMILLTIVCLLVFLFLVKFALMVLVMLVELIGIPMPAAVDR
ncbi:hypothetical protein BKA58DRAFT_468472 [Alternaria rosae]|uniref:uncharacterized protein n=1 Tax=Alternaria rosae TaxID=1187941 RepID=UPI001E8E38CB|nr:uncharacterized protein BKA58DRAFT_468472 [Alternaria rosae]KAH6872741.1 hypothetical protein BKA58DRAFT_468472 [Alternaria rosae]